ncbi:phosphatase PAP2 family protein [Streptomyces longisporus]|uniref:Phosphatase PAP2 family protein n=1 Tax=Streptomyces longisporus TaxID=1948 RepID=A0ABP5Y0P5_STRLO
MLLAVVCALLFAGLATAVGLRHGAPLPGDTAAHAWGLAHRPPEAVALARGFTATGTGPWPYVLVVIAGCLAGRTVRERLRIAVVLLVVLVAGQLVRTGTMELLARARPAPADWATHASGFAFPSGHATTSALTAGLLCWATTRRARVDLARTTCILAVCWAVAVGLTRVYLGVHWASDVIGGWLLAVAWLSLWWWGWARWLPVEPTGRDEPGAPGTGTALDAPTAPLSRGASGRRPPAEARGLSPSSDGQPTRPRPRTLRGRTHPRTLPIRPRPGEPPPTAPRPTHNIRSTPTTDAQSPTEDHAPQDPGRRGRSRPA